MPEHTEQEKRRKLPLLARFGRDIGEKQASSRVRQEQEILAQKAGLARGRQQFGDAVESVKTGFRQFGEGFSSGNQGRPVDTSAFDVGGGTTDTTPRPPPVTPEFEGDQVIAEADRLESDPFEPKAINPVVSLANSGSVVSAGGGSKVDRPNRATEAGQFEGGVPEGFINVIRGTTSRFQRVDDQGRVADREQAFRAVPGQTLAESERVAARRDPAFNVLTKEGLDRTRVNNETLTAEAQKQNAQANSVFSALDAEDVLQLYRLGADGVPVPLGLTPESIVSGDDQFSIETVQVDTQFPGQQTEQTIMFDAKSGEKINLTEEARQQIGAEMFIKLKSENPDASDEELLQQVETLSGNRALPNLRNELGL